MTTLKGGIASIVKSGVKGLISERLKPELMTDSITKLLMILS